MATPAFEPTAQSMLNARAEENRAQLHKFVDMLNERELEIVLTYVSNVLFLNEGPNGRSRRSHSGGR